MTDNIKPEHYRTGEIDLYEAWYRTYPFNEYRAIMQAVAERYMRRDKNDRVEDIGKAIYTLERLKEKEIERAGSKLNHNYKVDESIFLLKGLLERGFEYLSRDKDEELWMYDVQPVKLTKRWSEVDGGWAERIGTGNFPEIKWTDDEPTKIADLLATYENGGESGN